MKLFAGEIQDFEDVRGILQVSETISISHPYEDSLADMESRLTENWTPFSKKTPPSRQPSHDLLAPRDILFLNCGKVSPPGSAGDSSVVAPALSESAFG